VGATEAGVEVNLVENDSVEAVDERVVGLVSEVLRAIRAW